jgi:hypothetical protein
MQYHLSLACLLLLAEVTPVTAQIPRKILTTSFPSLALQVFEGSTMMALSPSTSNLGSTGFHAGLGNYDFRYASSTPRLEYSDTLRITRVFSGDQRYYRIPLKNNGEEVLTVSGASFDHVSASHSLDVAPGSASYYYVPESSRVADIGMVVVLSNSPYSPDTLLYQLDTTSLRPKLLSVHVFSASAPSLNQSIAGIARAFGKTLVQSSHETSIGNRVIDVSTIESSDYVQRQFRFNGTALGVDEALAFGSTPSNVQTLIRLKDTTGAHLVRFRLSGKEILKNDTIRGNHIEAMSTTNVGIHVRYSSEQTVQVIGNRTNVRGPRAVVQTANADRRIEPLGRYSSGIHAHDGYAYPLTSAVDSNERLYLLAVRDIGSGSTYEFGLEFDTVLEGPGVSITGGWGGVLQLETGTDGLLVWLRGPTITQRDAKGAQVSTYISGVNRIATGSHRYVYASADWKTLQLYRVDALGGVNYSISYSVAPYIKSEVKDLYVTPDDHLYVMIQDGSDVAVLHFDTAGTLRNSVYVDGRFLHTDAPVRFLCADTTLIVAVNATNQNGAIEGTLYTFTWEHPASSRSSSQVTPSLNDLRIHPNPANQRVSIALDEDMRSVRLLDMLGIERLRSSGPAPSLDVSALPSGAYIVEIETLDGTKRSRLLVQH